jgi:hypothetical protein
MLKNRLFSLAHIHVFFRAARLAAFSFSRAARFAARFLSLSKFLSV